MKIRTALSVTRAMCVEASALLREHHRDLSDEEFDRVRETTERLVNAARELVELMGAASVRIGEQREADAKLAAEAEAIADGAIGSMAR